MLKTLLSLFLTLWAVTATAQDVVYVDGSASGEDDGTTWADAYSSLQMAIDSSDAGSSLWLAAGTYTTVDSSFTIMKGISLYGGFSGSETSAEEADPINNLTILSGDAMENDGTAYDSTLAADNYRVLTVIDTAATSSFTVTIDGVTITNGAIADDWPGNPTSLIPYAGGGIYAEARVNMSRILFTRNRASFGSASCLIFSPSTGSSYDSIVTRGNYGGVRPHHYVRLADSVSFTNSTFDGENVDNSSGMIQAQSVAGFVIDNCTFTNILTPSVNGGALYTSGNEGQMITNSTFENCTSNFGGAVLIFGDAVVNDFMTVFQNCDFTGNTGARTGGAVYIDGERFTFSDCTFDSNTGMTGTIGSFGYGGDEYRIENSSFTNNGSEENPTYRGSALYAEMVGGDSLMVDSCTFENGITTQQTVPNRIVSGGAIFLSRGVSFSGDTRPYIGISNSVINANSSTNTSNGGAIYTVDGYVIDISDSDITNNSAESGGALYSLQFTEEVMDTTADGDTITFDLYPPDNVPEYLITRSLLLNNTAASQGGAADLQLGQMTMTNSLVIGNTVADGGGSGGAIIINGTDNAPAMLENVFVNNSFYNNLDGGREGQDTLLGASGNAIALFQPGQTSADSNSVMLTLQNNAFFQVDAAEESVGIEQTGDDGEIVINSLGGNFYSSTAQPGLPVTLISGADVTDVDILDDEIFLDPFQNSLDTEYPDLDLVRGDGNNPLIDAGTTGPLVPEVDYFNTERDSMPDIGAIEYNALRVDVAEPIQNSGIAMEFFPNPTADVLNIVNNDAKVSSFTVLVTDIQGRYVAGRQFSGVNNTLNVTTLPKGVYNLTLLIDGKAYSQRLMKQ